MNAVWNATWTAMLWVSAHGDQIDEVAKWVQRLSFAVIIVFLAMRSARP